jgi:signal transduction histidine kinase
MEFNAMTQSSSAIPLYNSRILSSYLTLLRKKYGHIDVQEILRHAGVKECEVADQGHWFTQRQVDLFHEKLEQLSGNSGISREAGRYAASTDSLGVVREFLLGLLGPEYVLLLITKVASNFSRSSRYTSRRIGHGEMEITVTFAEGVSERPYQCQNRIGYFETIFLLFNHEFPEIDHTDCIFEGGSVCRYRIKWQPQRTSRVVLARRASLLMLLGALILVVRSCPDPWVAPVILSVVPLHLVLSFLAERGERKSLLSSLALVRNTSEKLLAQVQKNYDSALTINEIGQAISKKYELEEVLFSVNQILAKRLRYSHGIVLLANADRTALNLRSCFGFTPDEVEMLERMEHPLALERPGVLSRCFQSQEAFLVNGLVQVEELVRPEVYPFLEKAGVRSFICVPIICEGVSLGVLGVDDANREGGLLQSDLNLIKGIAPIIGAALRNAVHLANERSLSEELRKASEQLERRVEERTAALYRAHEELESLYDSVSHDLRTPVRIIYGYAELVQDGYGDRLDEAAKGYLASIIAGGEQLEAALDGMLEYSKARVVELKLEPVDLSAMACRILKDLAVTEKGREVSARIQDDVVVTGDEGLLKSVMENLLGNAWKYSSAKEMSCIEFGREGGAFFVRDNGDGFDMAFADRLFRPFHRLHDSRSFSGHGLGLATVRRVVGRLGGTVWAEGRPGEGATFYFTLSGEATPGTVSRGDAENAERIQAET